MDGFETTIVLLVLFIAVLATLVYLPALKLDTSTSEEGPENPTDSTQNFCSTQSRDRSVCAEIYQPVCGWFNAANVQCIKYPCAETFSNGCFACLNQDVEYWTQGECPN
ncbi:MAG: hypothetical protein AABY10_05940, partial [Nanoarchaeota archaeon]